MSKDAKKAPTKPLIPICPEQPCIQQDPPIKLVKSSSQSYVCPMCMRAYETATVETLLKQGWHFDNINFQRNKLKADRATQA